MKKVFLTIILMCIISGNLQDLLCSDKKILLIGKIKLGQKTESISPNKVEAAINLATALTDKYLFIPTVLRDSIAEILTDRGIKPRLDTIADTIGADYIVFISVSRIHNMLRVELNLAGAKASGGKNVGEGYANIHYMLEDSSQLTDPALLEAVQRAFAAAVGDSNLFANCEEAFRVFPAATLVIGGLEYKDDPSFLPKWDLFDRPIVSSYDAIESIFEQAKESPRFVVYDNATRDSIYSIFNLFMIENFKPASYLEIEALGNFLVQRYITGSFTRFQKHAEIEITLNEVIKGGLKPLKTEKSIIEKDDLIEFRKILKELTKKLLD